MLDPKIAERDTVAVCFVNVLRNIIMKHKKRVVEICIAIFLFLLLADFVCRTLYTPVHEDVKNWGCLPSDVSEICFSSDPSRCWMECKMPLDSFLKYAQKEGFALIAIDNTPMKIGRYKLNDRYSTEDQEYHHAQSGYFCMIYHENGQGEKHLKRYILYDADNEMYYEEKRIR